MRPTYQAPMGIPVAGEPRPRACVRAPWTIGFRNGSGRGDLVSAYVRHADLTAKPSQRLKEWLQ